MDIASAKQQIKNTVQIYLQKDALGRYRLPLVHQRPVFLLGAPGLGKTAIMQQLGYTDIKTFVLPETCWTTHFYQPQAEAQRLFLERYPDNKTARNLVENQRHEAQLYDQYHEYYGYVFYIGKK